MKRALLIGLVFAGALAFAATTGPRTVGQQIGFGHVDAGTLPAAIVGGCVFDVIGQQFLCSDGGTWSPLAQGASGAAAWTTVLGCDLTDAGNIPLDAGSGATSGPWTVCGKSLYIQNTANTLTQPDVRVGVGLTIRPVQNSAVLSANTFTAPAFFFKLTDLITNLDWTTRFRATVTFSGLQNSNYHAIHFVMLSDCKNDASKFCYLGTNKVFNSAINAGSPYWLADSQGGDATELLSPLNNVSVFTGEDTVTLDFVNGIAGNQAMAIIDIYDGGAPYPNYATNPGQGFLLGTPHELPSWGYFTRAGIGSVWLVVEAERNTSATQLDAVFTRIKVEVYR